MPRPSKYECGIYIQNFDINKYSDYKKKILFKVGDGRRRQRNSSTEGIKRKRVEKKGSVSRKE